MSDANSSPSWSASGAAIAAAAALPGCGGIQSMLEPAGVEAARVEGLWWLLFAVACGVFAAVTAALLVALARRRAAHDGDDARSVRRATRAVGAAVAATIVLLLVIFAATLLVARPAPGSSTPVMTIRVKGELWWWEVTYLDDDPRRVFTTANELRIPVGRPVRIELLSDNVIHSFWVPSLAGKVDLVPGRLNHTTLHATEPGLFRGQCAEFCGLQHAKMAFYVVAMPPDELGEWLKRQREPALEPGDDLAHEGRDVFLGAGCARCHTIRGVSVATETGPDLTHLASRLSLAAGTLPNRRGTLAGWIGHPQALKPGNLMPVVPLRAEELHALVAYLESLE